MQPIAVVFPIPEDSLPRVVPKVRAGNHLKVDAFDRDPAKPTLLDTGSVLTLDNEVDPTTASVKVKAIFQNAHDALFPNQFVNVRVLVDTLSKVIVVPSAAVQRGPQATYVFVVKPDNTVDMRTVTVQLTEGDDTVVSKGVNVGEMVVTDGLDKLQPGARVQVRSGAAPTAAPAAATPPGVPACRRTQGRTAVNLSRPFIRRPIATSLLMAGLLLVGALAFGCNSRCRRSPKSTTRSSRSSPSTQAPVLT